MFEFMTKNITKPGVESIEEMIEKNFTIHVTKKLKHILMGMELMKK
jgi:hypothetical protein